jgi:putative S-methylcysteine transport system ATP-binding protein
MLKIHNLHKSFGKLQVLTGIDFEAKKGEVVVIVGPSGTGKSTFLRCINFLEIPGTGILEIEGDVVDVSQSMKEADFIRFRKHSAMVFQNYNLFKNKTVIQNVAMPMINVQKTEKSIANEQAMALLKQVGLVEKANEYPSRLSGGQQQRVGIARALAVKPSILLFDEPTSSLDPELVAGILDLIKNLARSHNQTMLIVTHEMRFAFDVADRIVFMDKGRIIEEGTPDEIRNSSDKVNIRRFLEQLS